MRWLAIIGVLAACESTPSPPPAPKPHLELVEAPGAGDVVQIIRDAVTEATRDHKQLVVYEGATWCEPCRSFHDAAAAGQLDQAFGNLRVLVFDADRDGEALAQAGYRSELIPLFAIPRPDGTPSGKQIEGAIKGQDAVAQITPRLQKLLADGP
ncbi:MAG TPA: hypothetical protein VL326_32910 [Kofleriaceae bacterium]|jgi:thiol-disulfide isomerase/thioredoxin|nr:hypothetical protein [Kofleriaceae bacterium]